MTASGRLIDPFRPRVTDIAIGDIAHHLSLLCRFNGAVRQFYSVAQHSILVSYEVGPYALEGLLHDASEYLLLDIPRPIKTRDEMAAYRDAEARLQHVIHLAFGIVDEPDGLVAIALADRRILRTEQRDLMPPLPDRDEHRHDVEPYLYRIHPWEPPLARERFLARFRELVARQRSPNAQGDGDHGHSS